MTTSDLIFAIVAGGLFLGLLGGLIALAQIARVGRALDRLGDWLGR